MSITRLFFLQFYSFLKNTVPIHTSKYVSNAIDYIIRFGYRLDENVKMVLVHLRVYIYKLVRNKNQFSRTRKQMDWDQ